MDALVQALTVQADPKSENYLCLICALGDLRIKTNPQHKQWKAKQILKIFLFLLSTQY